MGKPKRSSRDYDILDKMKYENAKLKRENARLRRLLDRVDIDKYSHLRDFVKKQHQEEKALTNIQTHAKLLKKWSCFSCGAGVLKPYMIERRDGLKYYRACTVCSKRTKLKSYTENVDMGLLNEDT